MQDPATQVKKRKGSKCMVAATMLNIFHLLTADKGGNLTGESVSTGETRAEAVRSQPDTCWKWLNQSGRSKAPTREGQKPNKPPAEAERSSIYRPQTEAALKAANHTDQEQQKPYQSRNYPSQG